MGLQLKPLSEQRVVITGSSSGYQRRDAVANVADRP